MSTLHLACAADTGYSPHAAAMLHSALENGGVPLHVHFLHDSRLARGSLERVRTVVEEGGGQITTHEVPADAVAGLPFRMLSPATWYRILLADVLAGVSRVLYLDVDTIVTGSLAELRDLDLDESYVAAVTNVFVPWHESHPADLGMPEGVDYFNAGVSLFNLERMRADGCGATLREFGRAHPDACIFFDQDALNLVLARRRVALHPRWNCTLALRHFEPQAVKTFGREARDEALADPAIMHWEGPGPNKPWHILCDPADRRLYRGHARRTPWRWSRPEGITPGNLVRAARRRIRP
jgi:lipopolysaccharide biosynthesis glycosyltransferase